MTKGLRELSVFVRLIILVSLLSPVHAVGKGYSGQEVAGFDWKQFGKSAIDRADHATKKRISNSTEEKARYIAQEVGRQLNIMHVMPNTNILTRGISWKRYGDRALGTCEHVTESLKDAMSGAGIDRRHLLRIFGEKSAVRSANPFDVNRNHMALALIGDGGEIVSYDLWMHGGEYGTFAKFEESIWNGQSVTAWSEIMRKNGYLKQACADCPDRSLKPACEMVETLMDQAGPATRIADVMRCTEETDADAKTKVVKKAETSQETAGDRKKGDQTEEEVVAEYRALLPAALAAGKKPWHTRTEIIANAVKVKAGQYRVDYKTYCIIEQGPDKGRDHMCFENDSVLNIGRIRAAVSDMRRRLGR